MASGAVSRDVVTLISNAEFELKRRMAAIRMHAESDLRGMRATFEVNLGFIPEHIKSMKYKDYVSASPGALENSDPNLRRQSSKLKPLPAAGTGAAGGMAPPLATPAAGSRSRPNGQAGVLLQTPMGGRTRAQKKAEAFYVVSAVDGSPLDKFTAETAVEVLKNVPTSKAAVDMIEAQLNAWKAELGL